MREFLVADFLVSPLDRFLYSHSFCSFIACSSILALAGWLVAFSGSSRFGVLVLDSLSFVRDNFCVCPASVMASHVSTCSVWEDNLKIRIDSYFVLGPWNDTTPSTMTGKYGGCHRGQSNQKGMSTEGWASQNQNIILNSSYKLGKGIQYQYQYQYQRKKNH